MRAANMTERKNQGTKGWEGAEEGGGTKRTLFRGGGVAKVNYSGVLSHARRPLGPPLHQRQRVRSCGESTQRTPINNTRATRTSHITRTAKAKPRDTQHTHACTHAHTVISLPQRERERG